MILVVVTPSLLSHGHWTEADADPSSPPHFFATINLVRITS